MLKKIIKALRVLQIPQKRKEKDVIFGYCNKKPMINEPFSLSIKTAWNNYEPTLILSKPVKKITIINVNLYRIETSDNIYITEIYSLALRDLP